MVNNFTTIYSKLIKQLQMNIIWVKKKITNLNFIWVNKFILITVKNCIYKKFYNQVGNRSVVSPQEKINVLKFSIHFEILGHHLEYREQLLVRNILSILKHIFISICITYN